MGDNGKIELYIYIFLSRHLFNPTGNRNFANSTTMPLIFITE